MEPTPIRLEELAGIQRSREPVEIGIPLKQGCWQPNAEALLLDDQENPLPCQSKTLALWPDGSIRWLLLTFPATMASHAKKTLTLEPQQPSKASSCGVSISETHETIAVDTGIIELNVNKQSFPWEVANKVPKTAGSPIKNTVLCTTPEGHLFNTDISTPWHVQTSGSYKTTLSATGQLVINNQGAVANIKVDLHCYHQSAQVKVDISIHNPQRAHHTSGLWDLGDLGSIHIGSLNLQTHIANPKDTSSAAIQAGHLAEPIQNNAETRLRIFQNSSGGDQWSCANHLSANQDIIPKFRGYRISNGSELMSEGERASPIAMLRHPTSGHSVSLRQFWQNFPSALSADSTGLTVELFPADALLPSHEIQGGERKTHTAYLDYALESPNALEWTRHPLVATLSAQHYQSASAFPWFYAQPNKTTEKLDTLDALIQQGLEGPNHFFAKREAIDEYGWRNFGDIFADHESHYKEPDAPYLISHYNNQYDAIYGLARQFCLHGDHRWFTLMDDLAKHVADIDIYQTTEDRPEYNGGLFWHTDHYLPAHTATHRTYTKHNNSSSTPGQTGGGPGPEHCYATGLLYHYWMTGSETSKQAVLTLANWMVAYHEGGGGLFEQLLFIKKLDIPKLKQKLRGQYVSTHSYPFTRATGNYINILLDAWQLTANRQWLEQAESVLLAAIHPKDSIENRRLDDIEDSWSYLILLSAIGRYIELKKQSKEFDYHYAYALSSFTHYTRWMVNHEAPFLNQPELLEYPNNTWSAQDIRKVMLMHIAKRFDPENATLYAKKAAEWLSAITHFLSGSHEADYTRVLIILMQNYGPQHIEAKSLPYQPGDHMNDFRQAPQLSWPSLCFRMLGRLLKGVSAFQLKRELNWIKSRLPAPPLVTPNKP